MKTKKTIAMKLSLLLLMFLLLSGLSSIKAQLVTVSPSEYPNALTNPLMGFRQDFDKAANSSFKYTTIVRDYINWSDIENSESDGYQKIVDFCNNRWASLPSLNVKVIPRIIVDWDQDPGNENWPADILTKTGLSATDPNLWKNEIVRKRIVKLIEKLGQAWNNDPRVAWIQTGIVGHWGEQEGPVGVKENVVAPDNSNWASIMGPAFVNAFPNKLLLVRNQNSWSQPMGVYWDSFAHTQQYPWAWTDIKNYNNQGRYLQSPVEGEVAYNWGSEDSNDGRLKFSDPPAGEPLNTLFWDVNSTHRIPEHYNFIINCIKQLHCSGLGWISDYTPGTDTETGTNAIQKAFGYRFHINEFKCSQRTEPGGTLTMSAKIKNTGSSVFHQNWPVAFILVNESTRQIVYQSVINGTDTRTWKPGSNFNWDPVSNPNGSKVYLNPAVDNSISASIPIPSNITSGSYLAGLAILDPSTQKPGVFFAVNSFFKQSQSQPLCRIGIGANASSFDLSGPFDNLVNDDARYYSMTPPTINAFSHIEAESYSNMSGVQSEPCNEGGQNVGSIETGDWMEYNVNVSATSTFTIDYRVASPNSGGQILCMNASGQTLSTTNVPNTGGWQTWTTTSSTSFSLPAGASVIRIKANVGGFNLNWIELKSGAITIPAKIEAENYSTMLGVQTESCSEGTLNVGWIETGDWMEYIVNVSSASTFTIDYRVASPNTGSQILCMNASGQTLSTTNVPNTTGFQTWATVSSAIFSLPAGASLIRIKANVGGFNLNWIEFKSAALIPNGTYTLKSKSGVYLTATTSIGALKSRTTENGNYTKWVFNHLGNDVYEIKSAQFANERMEVPYGGTTAGSLVAVTNYTGVGEHLKWKATKSNGYFMFEPMHTSGLAMDAWMENPEVVHIWNKDLNNNNQWFEVINSSGVALKSATIGTTNVDLNKSTANSISIYPNPVSKTLYLKSNNSTKMSEIEIYNLNGQLLHSVKATNSITEIDTKVINSKGIVVVKVLTEGNVSIFKVVIQ